MISLIAQQSESVVASSQCLFGYISGICSYNVNNPPVFFSLGEGIASFGLIFAVYQLRNESWKMILRMRGWLQRNLFWIFGGAGLFFILLATLVRQIPINYLISPFNYPSLYEFIAYFFFLSSPLSLIILSTKAKGLFKKDPSKFYSILVQEISKISDEGTDASLRVLLSNFSDICKASKQREDEEERESALAILDVILSDESVVKILTTKRLDALQFVFDNIEKYNISRRESTVGIPKIVQNLFYDKESFFYRHLSRDGLALSSNIYESIFDSPKMLTNFDLFGFPTFSFSFSRDFFEIAEISVFMQALSKSIRTYLKTGKVPARNINEGIARLSGMYGGVCSKISVGERRGIDTRDIMKDEWWALNLLTQFLSHDYSFLAYEETFDNTTVEREKNTAEADFNSHETINAGISGALYKAFEQLSYIVDTNNTYTPAVELLQGIMTYEPQYKKGYRAPFEKMMWEEIYENLRGYYPAVLRTYLNFIGFCLASDKNQRQGWIGGQAERMRRLLYVDLSPLLDKDTEMADGTKMKDILLPKSMDYKDGKFTYRMNFGRGEAVVIDPPPKDSKSALEGVDVKHKSLIF